MRYNRQEAVTVANYCSNCGSNAGYCGCPQPMQAVVGFVERTVSTWLVLMGLALEVIGWMSVFDPTVMSGEQRFYVVSLLIGVPVYLIYRLIRSLDTTGPARG